MSKFFKDKPRVKFFSSTPLNPECPTCQGSSTTSNGSLVSVEMSIAPDGTYSASEELLLDNVVITSSANSTISIGSSAGANDIGSISVTAGSPTVLTLHYLMVSGQTIYFTTSSGSASVVLLFKTV